MRRSDRNRGPSPSAASPASTCSARDRDFDRRFDRAYGLVAFAVNRHLLDHMLRARRELGVDFESLVIWGVLAHLSVMHLMPPGTMPSDILGDDGRLADPTPEVKPVRLRDIHQVTLLPRETVRRKLARLETMGFVERAGQGWIFSRDRHHALLREFTRESARRLFAVAGDVDRLLVATSPRGKDGA